MMMLLAHHACWLGVAKHICLLRDGFGLLLQWRNRVNNIKENLEKNDFPSEMPVSAIPVLIPLPPFIKKLNTKNSHLDIKSKRPKYRHLGFQKY